MASAVTFDAIFGGRAALEMAEKSVEKTPWLKKVLIPFWVAQFVVMFALLGVMCYVITHAVRPTELSIIILCMICVFLVMTELALFAISSLAPTAYLIFQCVETIVWFIVLTITIVTANQQSLGADWTAIGVLVLQNGLVEAVMLMYVGTSLHAVKPAPPEGKRGTFLRMKALIIQSIIHMGTLIYASVIYHRHRQAKVHHFSNSLERHRHSRSPGGPYGEDTVETARYETFRFSSNQQTCNGHMSKSPVECGDGEAEGKVIPSLDWTQELHGEGETHELATTTSMSSIRPGGGTVEAESTLK